jgi:hypothetical protein
MDKEKFEKLMAAIDENNRALQLCLVQKIDPEAVKRFWSGEIDNSPNESIS